MLRYNSHVAFYACDTFLSSMILKRIAQKIQFLFSQLVFYVLNCLNLKFIDEIFFLRVTFNFLKILFSYFTCINFSYSLFDVFSLQQSCILLTKEKKQTNRKSHNSPPPYFCNRFNFYCIQQRIERKCCVYLYK